MDMQCKDVASRFEVDRSLRDIYVSKTSVSGWDGLICLSLESGLVTYTREGDSALPPPATAALLEDSAHSHNMIAKLDGPVTNAHFFIAN